MVAPVVIGSLRRLIFVTAILVVSGFARGDVSAVQIETGGIAPWDDLETWSRPHVTSNESDVGLGLHLSGPGGPMLLALSARIDPSAESSRDIRVHVAASATFDARASRTATLRFVLNDDSPRRATIDLSPVLKVNNPTPGAPAASGVAPLSAIDLLLLSRAESISANLLGAEVEFRPDQMQGIDAFARRALFGPEN